MAKLSKTYLASMAIARRTVISPVTNFTQFVQVKVNAATMHSAIKLATDAAGRKHKVHPKYIECTSLQLMHSCSTSSEKVVSIN